MPWNVHYYICDIIGFPLSLSLFCSLHSYHTHVYNNNTLWCTHRHTYAAGTPDAKEAKRRLLHLTPVRRSTRKNRNGPGLAVDQSLCFDSPSQATATCPKGAEGEYEGVEVIPNKALGFGVVHSPNIIWICSNGSAIFFFFFSFLWYINVALGTASTESQQTLAPSLTFSTHTLCTCVRIITAQQTIIEPLS